jgi:hypothetical protein
MGELAIGAMRLESERFWLHPLIAATPPYAARAVARYLRDLRTLLAPYRHKKLAVPCVESCKSNETKEAQVNLMVELKEKAFSTSLTTDVGRSGTVRETT